MSPPLFRFRRFRSRILALLTGLLFVALAATYFFVSRASTENALAHSKDSLAVAARLYDDAIRQQIDYLSRSAAIMTGDYAIKKVLLESSDARTLGSTLQSYTQRVGAPVIALFDADGALLANSEAGMENENARPFRHLIEQAAPKDTPEASGFSYLKGELHALVVVPLYAPRPSIVAWFGLAFPIDRAFAQRITDTTQIELTFVDTENAATPRVLATTLPPAAAALVARHAVAHQRNSDAAAILDLPADRYVTLLKTQEMLGEAAVTVVLQRPLRAELAAAQRLENRILTISVAALALGALAALWTARGVSEPVQQLAAHTAVIARGDYAARLNLDRADELGQLATAMNSMSAGLAERDRVRDLLDKNVSPEIAAQLLREGSALGGEEREVTILFVDLRGFTTLSEKLSPPDLLALLNRYLDRMSGVIERHGGVIDKFIGDAIMALFGAPVAQSDSADRALAAALAMQTALAELNAEFAAEGRPALQFGIGINTGRVVAGNIGSHRRLNYSVIGDGVNIAARLQALTRTPEYAAHVITSAATVQALRVPKNFSPRPLGPVHVKGRAVAVEIFAVEK